jgi:hypothetical protein
MQTFFTTKQPRSGLYGNINGQIIHHSVWSKNTEKFRIFWHWTSFWTYWDRFLPIKLMNYSIFTEFGQKYNRKVEREWSQIQYSIILHKLWWQLNSLKGYLVNCLEHFFL